MHRRTVALAAVLPQFVRYDGRTGIARKQAEDNLRLEEQRARPSE